MPSKEDGESRCGPHGLLCRLRLDVNGWNRAATPIPQHVEKAQRPRAHTARVYNGGKSEEDAGNVPEARHGFSIATKAPGFSPGSLSYDNVIKNATASLKALNQEKIDLYYFHGPDRKTPLEESCRAIISSTKKARSPNLASATSTSWRSRRCTAPAQKMAGSLQACIKVSEILHNDEGPLAGGFFSKTADQLRTPAAGGRMDQMKHFADMYVNDMSLKMHDCLTQSCEAEKLAVKEATLRWLFHHSVLGAEDGVILGGSSIEQMEENLEACKRGLLPESVVDCFEGMWKQWQDTGKATPAWV
ncbi:hypothetical protein LTR17_026339 [Elasticomyces elasticus]|nr:hypothetical protein LTR17_026339 [Elasticomyces elasticus]